MFISGAVGMRERKGGLGDHDPEMRSSVMPWLTSAETKAALSSGEMSRSPLSSGSDRGFGVSAENGASVAGNVLAHVRSRFGSVTSPRTEAL